MTHDLKTWPRWFELIVAGVKHWEHRKNDRGYQIGDLLHLREFTPCERCHGEGRVYQPIRPCPACEAPHGSYTGRSVYAKVLHVAPCIEVPAEGGHAYCKAAMLSIKVVGHVNIVEGEDRKQLP